MIMVIIYKKIFFQILIFIELSFVHLFNIYILNNLSRD